MRTILAVLLAIPAFAAIPAGAIWTIDAAQSATGNVTGGFFNPGNTNFATDGTVDTNTGNTSSPVFSSASYNFVAGDVGAWLYVKSGTSTYPGWYQIASVASNKATLTGTIGAAVLHNATNRTYAASTAAGIASVGTPSSITWGIDYSQSASGSITSNTDLASVNTNTNPCVVTSAGSPFSNRLVGNGIRISNAGTNFTVGWYEVASVSGSSATLDGSCGPAASAGSGATFRVGGALSLASSDDAVFEKGIPGNDFLVKNGNYTVGGTVTIAAAGGSQNPIRIIGYNSLRGDNPVGSTRPFFDAGANTFSLGANWEVYNISMTGTAASVLAIGNNAKVAFSKFVNTSTTTTRAAVTLGATPDPFLLGSEFISYRGRALINSSAITGAIVGCYFHDSDKGISFPSGFSGVIMGNIFAGNVTAALDMPNTSTASLLISNNTFYGAENNLGIGINMSTSGTTDIRVMNNIIAGFTTGVSHADAGQTIGYDAFNAYYNNSTANATNWALGFGSISGTNPAFTNVTQIVSGTVATSTGSTVTAGGGATPFGSVVDNQDFLTVISATTATAGKYLITGHTTSTVTTSPAIGTGSNIVWEVTLGHNFAIGTALKALGHPGAFPGGLTTQYLDIGGVQRQEAGGGGTRIY